MNSCRRHVVVPHRKVSTTCTGANCSRLYLKQAWHIEQERNPRPSHHSPTMFLKMLLYRLDQSVYSHDCKIYKIFTMTNERVPCQVYLLDTMYVLSRCWDVPRQVFLQLRNFLRNNFLVHRTVAETSYLYSAMMDEVPHLQFRCLF